VIDVAAPLGGSRLAVCGFEMCGHRVNEYRHVTSVGTRTGLMPGPSVPGSATIGGTRDE